MALYVDRHGVPDTWHERLSRLTVELMNRSKARHALVALKRGGGEGRWIGATGVADEAGSPMTPDTPFFIASISKLFVATIVLRLQERGQLHLDDSHRLCPFS